MPGADPDGLAALTGRPVRSRYKRPTDPDVWPGAEGPHPPGRGGAEPYPWSLALDAVGDLVRDVPQSRRPVYQQLMGEPSSSASADHENQVRASTPSRDAGCGSMP